MGKPVPGFGDRKAQILILGLAPGAHGSNRTGRMFTGDASGDFLFPALHEAGFSTKPISKSLQDDLKLTNIFITAVCRCAPPNNKPTPLEQNNCRRYLIEELVLLENIKGIVALGSIAFNKAFDILKERYTIESTRRPTFKHGNLFQWEASPLWLLSSYHPSRQNTQTGRLTKVMFSSIWSQVNQLLKW
ncbi:MAG: uracil-DNA glycosylase [Pelolinea sp.]|nr:uracil-DNA glycosylase [Pelolinea sp.]